MRPITVFVALALAAAALPHRASAQTDPASFVSGRDSLPGGPPPTYATALFTVPAGQRFVLTDISFPDVPSAFNRTVTLFDDDTPRWTLGPRATGGSSSQFAYETSWRTGLAFAEGHTFAVRTDIPWVGAIVCWSGYVVTSATSAVPETAQPSLGFQVGPNPSRETVALRFELTRPARVALDIFDVQGRKVRTLERGRVSAGEHEARWDGRSDSGALADAGVYFARLRSDRENSVRRLVRVR